MRQLYLFINRTKSSLKCVCFPVNLCLYFVLLVNIDKWIGALCINFGTELRNNKHLTDDVQVQQHGDPDPGVAVRAAAGDNIGVLHLLLQPPQPLVLAEVTQDAR